jgi:3-hydroxybutyryl-CoA dehydrogenase
MSETNAPVGVIGTGVMGAGIAQRLVEHGVETILIGRRAEALAEARERIARGAKLAARRRRAATETVTAALEALRLAEAPEALAPCPVVLEAVAETYAAKREVLAAAAEHLGAEAVLATNTSSLSVARLAQSVPHPERLVGLHFMNPVPESHLAELVRHAGSGEAALARARSLAERLELTVVEVEDCPGFAVNRVLMPMLAEAVRLLESGNAEARDIDTALRLGCGLPMGPLALADFIGLDVVLAELEQLADELGPRFEPPELLRQLVADGHLGRKTRRGLLAYGG